MSIDLATYTKREQLRKKLFHKKFQNFLPTKESRNDNECWLWQGITDLDGYGRIHYHSTELKAHRVSYELYIGKIPSGFLVRHTCDNPGCVNPAHLLVGTQLDNLGDMVRRGRAPQGPSCKLKECEVEEIKEYLSKNKKRGIIKELAQIYNVSAKTISNIKHNRIWRYAIC